MILDSTSVERMLGKTNRTKVGLSVETVSTRHDQTISEPEPRENRMEVRQMFDQIQT